MFIHKGKVPSERSKADMATENGGLLPEDVIIKILSLLPVKTLLQFKCVCESRYGIITSSNFISLHLNNHYNNIKNGHLLAHFTSPQLLELCHDESLTDLSRLTTVVLREASK